MASIWRLASWKGSFEANRDFGPSLSSTENPSSPLIPLVFFLDFPIGFEAAQRSLSNPATQIDFQFTLLFYQIEPSKNGASPILPSSIARNSSAPNAKRIFEILWGILEGRTNSARPSRPCLKNCQNGTFWSVHGIWKFFGPNDFIWGAIKVPFFDFIQKMYQAPSSSVQVLIWEDKLDYLKNPSQDFKNFVHSSYEFLAMLEGKIREASFF